MGEKSFGSAGAKHPFIFVLGCVNSILGKKIQPKPTPPPPNQTTNKKHYPKNVQVKSCVDELFSAIDLCVTWLPTVLPACEKPGVCTEAEFAYEERVSMLLPSCVF